MVKKHTWIPPEIEQALEDDDIDNDPDRIVWIMRRLTVDIPRRNAIYAEQFWKALISRGAKPKHIIGMLFKAYGGGPETIADRKARYKDITKHAKLLSKLLKGRSENYISLKSLSLDLQDGIVLTSDGGLTPGFQLKDVLDDLIKNTENFSADTYAGLTKKNLDRDAFVKTLGASFKKEFGNYLYGTIVNAYKLLHDDDITKDSVKSLLNQ